VKPGEPWDARRAEDGRRQVERFYATRGHHQAGATLDARPRGGAMDLTFTVVEGPLTRIGRILVDGLTFTGRQVVLRELPFDVGSPLRLDDLAEARRRLTATRLFDRVDVGPLTPAGTEFADVEVSLREAKPWRLDFGGGYDTFEGLRGFFEIGHDNLFGTGRSIGLRERASQRGDRTELSYREPWVLGTPWQGEASFYREHKEEIGFTSDRLGGAVALQRELFEETLRRRGLRGPDTGLRANLRYRYDRFDRSDVDPSLVDIADVPDRQRVASVTGALAWELRDQPADPRRGGYHYVSLELGGPPLGGEVSFVKSRVETAWFVHWPPPTVLAVSARLGLAAPLGGSDSLAIEDRFFAGGATTIRGYREQRVGPRSASGDPTGGNALLLLNMEWRFPIWRWFGGVVFFDAGTVVPEVGDLSLGDMFPGAGAGLRIATPIGPVRFDVGYGFRRIGGERPVQFYLTIGHAF
jgi:outer membrane protein insertion porin family